MSCTTLQANCGDIWWSKSTNDYYRIGSTEVVIDIDSYGQILGAGVIV